MTIMILLSLYALGALQREGFFKDVFRIIKPYNPEKKRINVMIAIKTKGFCPQVEFVEIHQIQACIKEHNPHLGDIIRIEIVEVSGSEPHLRVTFADGNITQY